MLKTQIKCENGVCKIFHHFDKSNENNNELSNTNSSQLISSNADNTVSNISDSINASSNNVENKLYNESPKGCCVETTESPKGCCVETTESPKGCRVETTDSSKVCCLQTTDSSKECCVETTESPKGCCTHTTDVTEDYEKIYIVEVDGKKLFYSETFEEAYTKLERNLLNNLYDTDKEYFLVKEETSISLMSRYKWFIVQYDRLESKGDIFSLTKN